MSPEQKLFNQMVIGLRKQNAPSIKSDRCVYRSDDGCKCAIGHCIPDDQYYPDFDGHIWGLGALQKAVPALQGVSLEFLRQAQRYLHDKIAFSTNGWSLESFETSVRNFAFEHDLKVP